MPPTYFLFFLFLALGSKAKAPGKNLRQQAELREEAFSSTFCSDLNCVTEELGSKNRGHGQATYWPMLLPLSGALFRALAVVSLASPTPLVPSYLAEPSGWPDLSQPNT